MSKKTARIISVVLAAVMVLGFVATIITGVLVG